MPRFSPQKPSRHDALPAILTWIIAGAALLSLLSIVERTLNGVPMTLSQLTVPILLGALAGILFRRGEMRLGRLNSRSRENKARLESFFQDTPALLHSLDADGRLVEVSQAWLDTLGYRQEQVIGHPFSEFLATDDPVEDQRRHLQTLREQGEIRRHYRLRRADQREIDVVLTEIRHHDPSGAESLAVLTEMAPQTANGDQSDKPAYCDSLTGLPNRALLDDRLLHAIAQARRDNRQVGVFFFDLDRFKTINDTHGHAVGDMVLRSVAQRLKKLIREGDTFARLGGDEFVIVQADPNHDPNFAILARRILETLREPIKLGDRELYATTSIGVAIYPGDGDDPAALLKSADTAMYVAKSMGRNNVQFFSGEMNARMLHRATLGTNLRQALSNDDLVLHYQPQIDLASGRIVAVEAMLRWIAEDGRSLLPEDAFRIAEENGLIFHLGEWILEQACRQSQQWKQAGLPPLRMAVNVSGHHLRQSNFIDRFERILANTDLSSADIEIETSESSAMGHIQEVIPTLTDLKVRGFSLALDNFGTGYSSLLYLKCLPIRRIKITVDIVRDIHHNPDYAAIVEAIIAMAHRLGLKVTAVGVESLVQLEFLRQQGCDEVAGVFLSPPLPPEEIARLLYSNVDLLAAGRGGNSRQ
jgi:diguanylate cyclase (GGDEF)-like protein/PAS domain S-box-containing protein